MPKRNFNYLGTIQCHQADGFRDEAWKKLIAETDGMKAAKIACVASPITGDLLLVNNRQRPFLGRIERNGQLIGVLAGDNQLVALCGALSSQECRKFAQALGGEYHPEKITIHCDDNCGATQMMLAIGSGDASQLEKLLRAGADPNAIYPPESPNLDGAAFLLTQAAAAGADAACKLLLKHGAITGSDQHWRPLYRLAVRCQASTLKLFLKHTEERFRRSAPYWLWYQALELEQQKRISYARYEFARHLRNGVKSIDKHKAELLELGPAEQVFGVLLGSACRFGNEALVEYLLKAGADVNAVEEHGATPLFLAHQTRLCQKLLEAGAQVDHLNIYDRPAIATVNEPSSMELLIKRGVNVRQVDAQGTGMIWHTANSLFLRMWWHRTTFKKQAAALDKQYAGVLKQMLKAGASLSQNDPQFTTLMLLAQLNFPISMQLLLAAGESIDTQNQAGKTVHDFCQRNSPCEKLLRGRK